MSLMTVYGILLVEVGGGSPVRYSLDAKQISLGRGPENDIVLIDLKVSRRHALLDCAPGHVWLRDQGSSNGFLHNGRRVREALLQHGDVLRLGSSELRFFSADQDLQEENTALTAMGEVFEQTLAESGGPRLIVVDGEQTQSIAMAEQTLSIGRSSKADVRVGDVNVSRIHAHLRLQDDGYWLVDNGSRNGIIVDEKRLEKVHLQPGVQAKLGEVLVFVRPAVYDEDLSVVATRVKSVSQVSRPPNAGTKPTTKPTIERPSIELLGEQVGHFAPQAVPTRAPVRAVAHGRQPVIVVPGFMGSTLYDDDKRVWPDVKRFTKKPEFLSLPDSVDLAPRDLVSEVVVVPGLVKLDAYNRLLQYLGEGLLYQEGHNLFAFAYDWRRDLRHAARELGEQIARWQEQVDLRHGKFVIVAHSAGGLVARYYIERMGGRHHVDRLILMGCPNQGTLKTLTAMLTGIGLLPFGARKERLREVVGTFPAAYQLLPSAPSVFDVEGQAIDLFADRDWVPKDVWPLVEDARAFISELGTRSRVPVVSIFGYGHKTTERITVKRDGEGRFISPVFHDSEHGDGTVLQRSAVLDGSEIHPVRQHHGALYTDRDVKMRLRLELLGQQE